MELIYTCISKLVSYLHKSGRDYLIGHMAHYYDPNDFNQIIYHCSDVDTVERFRILLSDAHMLLDKYGCSFEEVTEYPLFI